MEQVTVNQFVFVAMIIGPPITAFIGVKMALNGLKAGQRHIEKQLDKISNRQVDFSARISVLESRHGNV